MTAFWFLILAVILFYICFTDFKRRIISNVQVLLVCMVLLPFYMKITDWTVVVYSSVILLTGFILFSINIIAAGDTKLLFILSLAIRSDYILDTLFVMTLFGGVLAVSYLIYGYFTDMMAVKQKGIPYGIPISLSGYIGIAASFS